MIGSIFVVLLFVAASKFFSAINQSTEELQTARSSLEQVQRNTERLINQTFSRTETLLLRLARQHETRIEWMYFIEQQDDALTGFLADDRNQIVFSVAGAKATLYLGRLKMLRGDDHAARQQLQRSIELSTSIKDIVLLGYATNTMGVLHAGQGDFNLARDCFRQSANVLEHVPGQDNVRAMALCNLALVHRVLGFDDAVSMRQAIELMERCEESKQWGLASELLHDLRMTQCELHWSMGRIDEAIKLARQTKQAIEVNRLQSQSQNIDKHLLVRNRYVNALRYIERNLEALTQVKRSFDQDQLSSESLGETSSAWQWQRLLDLSTELVSNNLNVSGTMVGEFEPQSGIAIAWETVDFSHQAAIEIAKHVHDRTQLLVVSDIEDSLDEARFSLENAGVPVDRVRFGIADCEAPWLRDQGPIVARSRTGDAIWFDSRLSRHDRPARCVLDALPTVLRRNWKARIAEVPIFLEGGMLLSNGAGVTIGSEAILSRNRRYGFADQTILRELRRVTGAKSLVYLPALIGEPTEHIDLFMSFVSRNTVVVGKYSDATNPNAGLLDENAEKLARIYCDGAPLRVVRIPMPEGNANVFPSYTNVIFANGVLLVPSYSTAQPGLEVIVKQTYEGLLPDWEVRFIDCSRLVDKGGALHCLASNLGHTLYTPFFPVKAQ